MSDTTKAETRLEEVDWEGVRAFCAGASLTENPHEEGSRFWWMWRLAFLREQECDEHEELPSTQAALAIQEQPRWERREQLGINELVRRIQNRAEALGQLFGLGHCPPVFLEEHRRLLLDSVEELLGRTPG